MSGGRCAAAGCGRFVRAGASWCARHEEAARREGGQADRLPGGENEAAREEADERDRRAEGEGETPAAEFRRRLARGEYRTLFDPELARIIAQAATERGLDEEIGALRFVLARLLKEEQDLTKLATNVARVTTASIQAARAQRAISGELADSLTAAVTQILAELDSQ